MSRLLGVIFLLCALPATGLSAELIVKGNIDANWSSERRISPAQDAIVHLGDAVTVSLSGQVDINQETRHESHCGFLGLDCHDVAIPVHNFRTPAQVPVRFEIRPVAGGPPIVSKVVDATPLVMALPVSTTGFTDEYEIVALLNGAGTSIAPGRSGGSFDVHLEIDATNRANYYSTWLNQSRPSAAVAVDPHAIAEDLRTQGAIVSAGLRRYADANFPVPNAVNNDSYGQLVRKAVELAPGDIQNTLALARYLRAVGLDALANATLADAINKLQNQLDPHSRRQLGDAYLVRMDAALQEHGGVDPTAAASALSFADGAISAYGDAKRPDLVSQAQFARGRLLRGLRTRESLLAAEKAFNAALADVPDVVKAESLLQTRDGAKIYAMRVTNNISVSSIVDGPRSTDPGLPGGQPLAWDSVQQRLLVSYPGGLEWVSANLNAPSAAPSISPGIIQVGAGAIVRLKDFRVVDYISKESVDITLPIAGTNTTTCIANPPYTGGGTLSLSISTDGSTVAVVCNTTLRVFLYKDGRANQILEKTLPTNQPRGSVMAIAGPASCGTVLVTQPYIGHSAGTLSLLRGGAEFKLADLILGPDFPVVTSSNVAFAGDAVLIALSTKAVARYRCADGGRDGEIALTPAQDPAMGASVILRWISATELGVIRDWTHSVDVIDWPSQIVSHYQTKPDFSGLDLVRYVLLPPASSGGAPRILNAHRVTELTEWPMTANAVVVHLDIPGTTDAISLTGDASHVLVQRPDTPPWIAENKQEGSIVRGGVDEFALDTIGASSWVAGTIDINGNLKKLDIRNIGGEVKPIALPDAPPAYYASLGSALKLAYDAWKKLPPAPEVRSIYPNKELPKLIADPTLVVLNYRVLSSGLASHSFLRLRAAGPSLSALPPLAGSGERAFVTICGAPSGKLAPDAAPLPVVQFTIPDQLFVGTELNGGFDIQIAPTPNLPVAPGSVSWRTLCPQEELVRGLTPTVLLGSFSATGLKQVMLTPVGWVPTMIPTPPVAGWAPGDGTLLLLLPKVGPPGKFDLVRVNPDGSVATACEQCNAIPLLDSLNALAPTTGQEQTFEKLQYLIGGPATLIMIDPKGRLLARPDGDETIVTSLVNGKILRRVPLGKPLLVSDHLLTVTSLDGRVRSYPY